MLVKAFCTGSGVNQVVLHLWILCFFSSFPDAPLVSLLPSSPVFLTPYCIFFFHFISCPVIFPILIQQNEAKYQAEGSMQE